MELGEELREGRKRLRDLRHVAPSGGAVDAFGLYVGDWIFSSVHYLKKGHLCGGVNKWNRSFVFTEWDKAWQQ